MRAPTTEAAGIDDMRASLARMRGILLTREELSRLTEPRPARVLLHIALHWMLILLAWWIVALAPSLWTVLMAIVVVGTQMNALLVIAHDGIHRRVANTEEGNDAIVDMLVLGSVGSVNRVNRINHIEHHKHLCEEADPDRPNFSNASRPDRIRFLLFFTGALTLFRQVRNIFGLQRPPSTSLGYRARDIIAIAVWQCALIAGLTIGIGWWAFPVLWLLPLFLFYFLTDMARQFGEHSDLVSDEVADRSGRLITFSSNPLERLVFSPHNMNYHAVHHLWPTIPYFNLPEVDRLVKDRVADEETILQWRGSYLAYFAEYFRRLPELERAPSAAPPEASS